MAELVKERKLKYFGLSECSGETLSRVHKVHPIIMVQVEYSLWYMDIEKNGLLDAARELGVTIVAYFLTSNTKNFEHLPGGFSGESILDLLHKTLTKTCSFVSGLRALDAKKQPNFFVIPGTKKVKYFDQNWNCGQIKLSDEELAEINALVESAEPQVKEDLLVTKGCPPSPLSYCFMDAYDDCNPKTWYDNNAIVSMGSAERTKSGPGSGVSNSRSVKSSKEREG
ncbi:NADP-dependent oxidoreductase domain-containing protein [Fennellomyces sp. T-0311]|nr:NADP-dependent oxidoreductase domain-containing protein [Fennellomyces sp. T-0311]